MDEDWVDTTDYLPDEFVRVKIETPKVAYIGRDGYWHDSSTGEKIPSHLVTGWTYINS